MLLRIFLLTLRVLVTRLIKKHSIKLKNRNKSEWLRGVRFFTEFINWIYAICFTVHERGDFARDENGNNKCWVLWKWKSDLKWCHLRNWLFKQMVKKGHVEIYCIHNGCSIFGLTSLIYSTETVWFVEGRRDLRILSRSKHDALDVITKNNTLWMVLKFDCRKSLKLDYFGLMLVTFLNFVHYLVFWITINLFWIGLKVLRSSRKLNFLLEMLRIAKI